MPLREGSAFGDSAFAAAVGVNMDQLTAFVHGSFNVSSVHILESCFASEVALVQTMADGALDTTVQTAESAP